MYFFLPVGNGCNKISQENMREVTVNQVTEGRIINMLEKVSTAAKQIKIKTFCALETYHSYQMKCGRASMDKSRLQTFITGRYSSKKGQPHPLQMESKLLLSGL